MGAHRRAGSPGREPRKGLAIPNGYVATDKNSGIVKDANAYATETVGDPRYPLSLLLRVITVSLETMKIVSALPKLDEMDGTTYPTADSTEYLMAADSARPRD